MNSVHLHRFPARNKLKKNALPTLALILLCATTAHSQQPPSATVGSDATPIFTIWLNKAERRQPRCPSKGAKMPAKAWEDKRAYSSSMIVLFSPTG